VNLGPWRAVGGCWAGLLLHGLQWGRQERRVFAPGDRFALPVFRCAGGFAWLVRLVPGGTSGRPAGFSTPFQSQTTTVRAARLLITAATRLAWSLGCGWRNWLR